MTQERFAEVVEFSPRVAAEYYDDDRSGIGRIVSQLVSPFWWWTSRHVDDWGRDDDLTSLTWSASRLRWDVSVGGANHVAAGGGLFVINDRRSSFAGIWSALSIGAALGRPVRFAGRPELPVIGPLLQRIGGLLPIDDDVAGALSSGQLVVVCAESTTSDRRCGRIDPALIQAAIQTDKPIYPTGTTSSMISRDARVDITKPLPSTKRRGLLGSVETADAIRRRIDKILGVFGEQSEPRPADFLSIPGRRRR